MDYAEQKQQKLEFFKAQAQQYNFTREYSKAMEFYIRAGLLGDLESIQEACEKLRSGYGMSYNYNEIFRCMKIGAEAGLVDAMLELSICYGSGIGTEVDSKKALYWTKKGAQTANKQALERLKAYEDSLNQLEETLVEEDDDVKIYTPHKS